MRQTPRDYQESGVARVLEAFKRGAQTVLLVLATGGGKTTVFCLFIEQLALAGLPCLILVHRRELATQAAARLQEFGLDFGYIMAGKPEKPYARIQIASVQTLVRRIAKGRVPKGALVVCDEAHLSTAKTWRTILDAYPQSKILGVTATPWRLSGKPLASVYDAHVVVATPRELRERGYLCNYVGFSYKTPDLSKVRTMGGDYNEQQSAEAMRAPDIVDNVVEQWLAHASTLSTIVFAVTKEHSKELTAKFKAAGVAAEHLDGDTPTFMREAILKRVEQGTTRVLCNVGVAVEGLDIPRIKCIVLARPTKSLARFLQMVGRGRRPWGNLTCRIHDHAFCIKLHGLPDADRDYSLDAEQEKPPTVTRCNECFALYSGIQCPACSHQNEGAELGERVLATVPDAEQFTFASGQEQVPEPEPKPAPKPLPRVQRPPVEVRWDDPGRVVEGRLVRAWDEPSRYGKLKTYLLRGKSRDYRFHGTTALNALLAPVPFGSLVRVTYERETLLSNGHSKKLFKLEVDDGT